MDESTSRLWLAWFGADPTIVGQTLVLDEEPRVVIGVLPRQLLVAEARAAGTVAFTLDDEQFWTPLRNVRTTHSRVFGVLGLLRPRMTPTETRARLAALSHRLEAYHPDSHAGADLRHGALDRRGRGWRALVVVDALRSGGRGLVIACVNVAHLLLLRAACREREIAVRSARGAGRFGMARLFLAEDLILAFAGGILGLVVAQATVRGFVFGQTRRCCIQYSISEVRPCPSGSTSPWTSRSICA